MLNIVKDVWKKARIDLSKSEVIFWKWPMVFSSFLFITVSTWTICWHHWCTSPCLFLIIFFYLEVRKALLLLKTPIPSQTPSLISIFNIWIKSNRRLEGFSTHLFTVSSQVPQFQFAFATLKVKNKQIL